MEMYSIRIRITWTLIILCVHNSPFLCDVNVNDQSSPFISKNAAATFHRIVKRGLHEECVVEGCSWEEVEEVTGSWRVCETLKELKCGQTNCGSSSLCKCERSNGDCGSYGGTGVSCNALFEYSNATSIPACITEMFVNCWTRGCHICNNGHYVDNGQCPACPSLAHCIEHICTTADDVICTKCELPVYYKLYNDRCTDKCSSSNRWCWPGICSAEYAFNCACAPGFVRRFNSDESTCQPQMTPNITLCTMKVQDIHNDVLLSPAETSDCSHQRDFYGNIQIVKLTTSVTFDFLVHITGYTMPDFVQAHSFGITDAEVRVVKKTVTGSESITSSSILKSDPHCISPQTVFHQSEVELSGVNVINGERLCLRFYTKGGGHLISKNIVTHATQSIPYDKTETSRDLCYMFDDVAPEHCLETSTCTYDPLILSTRITSDRNISVQFDGWSDPYILGHSWTASQIEFYEITVHEVKPLTMSTLAVDHTPLITIKTTSTVMELQLPDTEPMLYAIILLVKDVAGNYRQSRRFILFDNSTEVLIDSHYPLRATSCTKQTNYIWQINLGSICYSWNNRYYNSKFRDVNYLHPTQQDHHGLITGVYEQNDGLLPVQGTTNVDGIIDFQYSLTINNQQVHSLQSVTNVTSQTLCISPHIQDGDTVNLNLTALDIVGHSLDDSVTIYIDSSPPEISNAWLVRDHHKQLYVHNRTDLSKMKLEFESMDPHSGIHTVHWCFGTDSGVCNIGQGALGVVRLLGNETCVSGNCYCPSIGACEYFNYSLSLNALVANNTHMGQHNRDYHFKLTVTNIAQLITEHYVQILVDDSPPEQGVIREGAEDSADIDYTSEDHIMVYWRGFIDHESGIKFYRVGIAPHCLSLEEMENSSSSIVVFDTWLQSINFYLNDTGKYYSTVIAFNKALEPSEPSCSDGVVKDNSAPFLADVILINTRMKSGIYCDSWNAFQVFSNIKKKKVDFCDNLCHNTLNEVLRYLPDIEDVNENHEPSNQTCENIIPNAQVVFYLPSDRIHATWRVYDNESQIKDVYVGFGSDFKDQVYPDILPYEQAINKTLFIKHSAGFQSGTGVFMFIKSVNKAGLMNTVTFGPIVIDETAPICPEKLQYVIDQENIFIGWKAGELKEDEMWNELPTVFSRLNTPHHPVTPLQKTDMISTEDCPTELDHCFKFSIQQIQHHITKPLQPFYCQTFIYNNANLSCLVSSQYFYIPSSLAQIQGFIFDLDKTVVKDSMLQDEPDIDVSLSEGEFCIAVVGIHPHPGLNISLGVGTGRKQDDVVAFHRIEYSDIYCELSSNLDAYQKYYITVNFSELSGTLSEVSDGFLTVREGDILNSIRVFDGPICRIDKVIESQAIASLYPSDENVIRVNANVLIGKRYTLEFKTSSVFILIASNDTFLIVNGSKMNYIEDLRPNARVEMISSVDHPTFIITNQGTRNVSDLIMEIQDCEYDIEFHPFRSSSSVHWEINEQFLQYISYFHVSLARVCQGHKNCTEKYEEIATQTLHADSELTITFENINLESSDLYVHIVKPCLSHICLGSVSSNGFTVIDNVITGAFHSQLVSNDGNCSTINTKFDNFICGSADHLISPSLYKLRIFRDSSHSFPASDWQTLPLQTLHTDIMEAESCITLDIRPHSPMYSCIRGFCLSGISKMICEKVEVLEDPNIYPKQTIYDIDTTSAVFEEIKHMVHSSNIGPYLAYLHEQELDYAFPNISLGGVVIGLNNRNVKWYLMTKRSTPVFECTDDVDCTAERENNYGYVIFKSVILQPNNKYFICLKASNLTMVREVFSESFDHLELCSNGVVIDNTSPSTGEVAILNTNGYITSLSTMILVWNGITDNTNQNEAMDTNGIANLQYSIGTSPYNQDLLPYVQSFQSHGAIVKSLDLKNGMTYFANIKATDYVGLSSISISRGVILDMTAPTHGKISVGNIHRHKYFIGRDRIDIYWSGFKDKESGIIQEEIGIGSSNYSADVVKFEIAKNGIAEIHVDDKIKDGHCYYCFLRVTNGARLSSVGVACHFILDRTKPVAGVVLDGPRDGQADIDYQTNTTTLWAHWNGFKDPHSGIAYYKAGIGTSQTETNIKPLVYVGLRNDMMWHVHHLEHGQRYYMILEACNRAGLCTLASSNGVIIDNSPPVPGIVEVGVHGTHSTYIPSRTHVHAQWIGFHDPQSLIKRYGFCIGTLPDTCDVIKEEDVGLSLFATKTNTSMPLSTKLYVKITAYNHADLSVTKSSRFIIVDDSPPIIVRRPTFLFNSSLLSKYPGYQWDTSLIEIQWEYKDPESHISKHFLSLYTHHNGHTPVENLELADVSSITLHLDERLISGDVYFASVSACNGAGLCTVSESEGLTIDSTPPVIGGFVTPMSWTNTNKTGIAIEWTGFVDVESKIKSYFVTVGSTYSGLELSGGVLEFEPNPSFALNQETFVNLTEFLHAGDKIILSIWAENNAGLMSDTARVTLELVSTDVSQMFGLLMEERHSCDIHYCNKDCTCAVVGRVCSDVIGNVTCMDDSVNGHDVNVSMKTVMPNMTASSVCVSAEWYTESDVSKQVWRYEWSIGILGHPFGSGIFNTRTENIWHDIGKRSDVIFCLSGTKQFTHNQKYVFYVRSWTSFSNYSVSKSDPILVDTTPPSLRRGGSIKVNSINSCKESIKYLTTVDGLSACWDNVFRDTQSSIKHYSVFLGTSPGVSDVVKPLSITDTTNHTWTGLSLYSKTEYYVTVVARNGVGLETSLSSQGFVIDIDRPTAGVVYNKRHFKNKVAQSSTSELQVSWTGFYDEDSYIQRYEIAFSELSAYDELVLDFTNVGLHTSYTILNANLIHGHTYISTVRATDAAGFSSEIVKSEPILIDVTPPVGYTCSFYETVYSQNVTLKDNETYADLFPLLHGTVYKLRIVSMANALHDSSIEFNVGDNRGLLIFQKMHNQIWKTDYDFIGKENESVLFSLLPVNLHSQNFEAEIFLDKCDSMIESLNGVVVSQISLTEISVSTFIMDAESGISDIKIGIGFAKHSYQIRRLESITGHHVVYEVHVPHGTPIFVTAVADNQAGLSSNFQSNSLIMDHTVPFINDINMDLLYSLDQHNRMQSSVIIHWKVHDAESGIKMCYCALGTHKESQNIKEWFRSNETNKCVKADLFIPHGTILYGSVRCVNNVELYSDLYSEPVTVSFMKPTPNDMGITIIDKSLTFMDDNLAQSDTQTLQFYWNSFLDASEIKSYQYRLAELTPLNADCNNTLNNSTDDLNVTESHCTNSSSLNAINGTSGKSSSGKFTEMFLTDWNDVGKRSFVTVNHLDFENGNLYKIETRATNTGLRTSESSYTQILLDGREPEITGKTNILETNISLSNKGWTGHLDFENGNLYKVETRATNTGLRTSESSYTQILLDGREPEITDTDIVLTPKGNRHYTISWTNVFHNPTIFDMSYVVVVGTDEGFSDIMELETTKESADIELVSDANSIHIVLTAKLQTGTETKLTSHIVL